MILATSPGCLTEMTITAQALQISVPLVVAFHLFRVVMVNMGTSISMPALRGCWDGGIGGVSLPPRFHDRFNLVGVCETGLQRRLCKSHVAGTKSTTQQAELRC